MTERIVYFVIPGDIQARTGGYGYDREIIAGLRARGWTVRVVSLPGKYPFPGSSARDAALRTFAAIPAHASVIVDGLAFGALPSEVMRERNRLRFVALVHHPLGHETGIGHTASLHLLTSEREALEAARGVIVTSRRTASALQELGVSSDAIAVVEPGTKAAPISPGSASSTTQLLCVASLVPRKGHDTLCDALMHLAELPWHLTWVGSLERDTACAADMVNRCAVPPLAGRVSLVGELTGAALDAAYAAADLFVLPTHYEGYGMVVAEALACALPVVSTPTGAIEELVGDDAGVLVPVANSDALADALHSLLTRPEELARVREGARRARHRLPTWPAACQRMEAALERFTAS